MPNRDREFEESKEVVENSKQASSKARSGEKKSLTKNTSEKSEFY